MRRILTLLALLAGLLLPAAENNAPLVNSVLASVNGEPISLVDILPGTRSAEFQAYALYSGERLADEIRKIRLKAVDDRIDKALVLAAYREKPFDIPKQSIEEELDSIAERMGCRSRSEFVRKLRESGTTIEELNRQIEEYIIMQMMIFDQLRIASELTPRDVYEYYQKNEAAFISPETLELAMILLDNADPELESKVKIISGELEASPDAFASLAKRYSAGPDAESGGKLGAIERKRLRAEFAAAMPELEVGRVYGPIRTVDGVTFLRLLSHREAAARDFKALAPEIRRKMELEQRERIRRNYLNKLREKAIIRYFI